MEKKLSHHSERGTWAPFVGVALAALTIGSLVLFSVIAQRTAGGAFITDGITARAPSQQAARSITLATGSGGGGSVAASERTAVDAPAVTASSTSDLLAVDAVAAPPAPVATNGEGSGGAADPAPDTGERVASADDLRPFFRMSAGGPHNGEVEAANRGKNANGEGRSKKDKDSKRRKDAKGNNGNQRSQRGRARRADDAGRPRTATPARGAAPSSRPAPKVKPAPKAPKASSASNHPNQRGKGHAKGRGRGHRH